LGDGTSVAPDAALSHPWESLVQPLGQRVITGVPGQLELQGSLYGYGQGPAEFPA